MRLIVPAVAGSVARAVAVEDALIAVPGVRAAHVYPRTASVVVWYSPGRVERPAIMDAIASGAATPSTAAV